MTSALASDIMGLPAIRGRVTDARILDPGLRVVRTCTSDDQPGRILDISSASTGLDDSPRESGPGVWVGARLENYETDALLTRLRIAKVVLMIMVAPEAAEPWALEWSRATTVLASRLGISLILVHDQVPPLHLALQVEALLREDPVARAERVLELLELADQPVLSPRTVGEWIARAAEAPAAVLGPQGAEIWRSAEPAVQHTRPLDSPTAGFGIHLRLSLDVVTPMRIAYATALLRLGSLLLTRWSHSRHREDESDRQALGSLISQVLTTGSRVPARLLSIASAVDLRLNDWHVVISTPVTSSRSAMDLGLTIAAALEARGFPVRTVIHDHRWTFIRSQHDQPHREQYLELVAALEQAFASPGSAAAFGVSRPRQGAAGLRDGLAEAAELSERGGRGVVRRTRVNSIESPSARLLRASVTDPALLQEAEGLLGGLLEPERRTLLETLRVHLDAESTIAETARVLQAHRNTVVGRLARIEEVLGKPLDDHEFRLALRLALRAVEAAGEW